MHTVICAFDDRHEAQRAMERLIERGFRREMIHLQSGHSGTSSGTTATAEESHGFFHNIAEMFRDLFGTDDTRGEAGHYAEAVRRGGTVLVVDAVDEQEAERAESVMSEMGGTIDMEERTTQWRSEGWTGFDPAAPAYTGQTAGYTGQGLRDGGRTDNAMGLSGGNISGNMSGPDSGVRQGADSGVREGTVGQEQVLPVVQEEIQVGKRAVQGGGVRVIQRVTETPVSEMVRLREERAVVERRPVDRPATEADFANFREGTIEVRETSEEAVVGKTARVVEEVVVGKEVQERTETISDTVRRTDVEVEQLGGERSASTTATRLDETSGMTGTAGTTGTTGTTIESGKGDANTLTERIPDDELTSRTK
jgi:uncharacterized protein (TIGR02271 family)